VAAGGADDVEIALGVYVRRVVRRWWIVVAAIVVAVAIAAAGSSSGHTTFRASALLSLGTPYTATGGAAITSAFCTSPIAPATLIKQDAIRIAAEHAAVKALPDRCRIAGRLRRRLRRRLRLRLRTPLTALSSK